MAETETAVDTRAANMAAAPAERSRRNEWSWNIGASTALALGTWWVVRTWTALERAHALLDVHVERYGALPIGADGHLGALDWTAPGAETLTRDVDAAAGFLYPFGEFNAFGGGVVAVVAVAVLTGRARPILASAGVVSAAIITMLVRHHAILGDLMAILE